MSTDEKDLTSHTWVTANRKSIPVCDLSDQHLVNIVKLIMRRAKDRVLQDINTMYLAPLMQGEAAQDSIFSAIETAESGDYTQEMDNEDLAFYILLWLPDGLWNELCKEVEKRSLRDKVDAT